MNYASRANTSFKKKKSEVDSANASGTQALKKSRKEKCNNFGRISLVFKTGRVDHTTTTFFFKKGDKNRN